MNNIYHKAEGFTAAQPIVSNGVNGERLVSYIIDDKTCPAIFIKSRDGQKAARYRSIIKDLEYTIAVAELALETILPTKTAYQTSDTEAHRHLPIRHRDILIARSAYISSVITYAKAFSNAHGRGLKLEPKDIFESTADLKIHQRVVDDRHDYIAHAGKNKRETTNTIVLLDPDGTSGIIEGPFTHASFVQKPQENYFRDLIRISNIALSKCLSKEQDALREIGKLMRSKRPEELYAEATTTADSTIPKI